MVINIVISTWTFWGCLQATTRTQNNKNKKKKQKQTKNIKWKFCTFASVTNSCKENKNKDNSNSSRSNNNKASSQLSLSVSRFAESSRHELVKKTAKTHDSTLIVEQWILQMTLAAPSSSSPSQTDWQMSWMDALPLASNWLVCRGGRKKAKQRPRCQ